MFSYKTSWLLLFLLLFGYAASAQTKIADSLKQQLGKTGLCSQPCVNDTVYLSTLESLLDAQQKASAFNDVQVSAAKGSILSDSLLNKSTDSSLKQLFTLFKARFINRIGNLYYARGKADSAIYYYRTTIPLFKLANDSLRLARVIGNIGITYRLKDQYDSAVYYLFFVINNFKNEKFLSVLPVCYNSLSIIYRTTHIYNKALEFSFAALKIATALHDETLTAQVENSISNIYKDLEDYQQSKKYMLLAYNGAKKNNNLIGIGFTATNLALVYIHLNRNDSAIIYVKEGLNAKLKVGNMSAMPTSYEALARVYEKEKSYDSAIYYFTKQIDTATKYKMPEFIKGGNYLLGNLYLMMNNYAPAKTHLLTAFELTKITPDFLPEISFALSELYEKLGDYKQSLNYYKTYKAANDSVHNEDLARSVTQQELNMLYENEQQKQKEAAVQQHAIEEQALQTQKNLRNIFIIVLGVAIIIVLLLYNRYRLKQKTALALEAKNKIINEQKLHAEKLREEAEESKKIKEQFLANMSHEIRTPMHAIKGITELLEEKTRDEESLRYIHAISQSSTNLLVILNDVLDLSKIQAGKFFIRPVIFSLKEQIKLIYETLVVLANEKRIDLTLSFDETIPTYVTGDPVRISQVLYNIINNAIKFTDKGSVRIDIKSEAGSDENNSNKEKTVISFIVADTGCGIPTDKQQTIFESFAQLTSTKVIQQQGTGLGLTISKLLVELMHGEISLISSETKGSTFTIRLPLNIPVEPGIAESYEDSDELITLLKGVKILIAEDNQYNRMMITDTLQKKIPGIDFDVVNNGHEAIEQLQLKDYDIILMDVRMPVMDGFAATEYIRNQMNTPKKSIPIIALTASVLRTDLGKCITAGMNAYIAKPFNRKELFNKMASVLKTTTIEAIIQPGLAKQTNLEYLKNFTENDIEEMRYYLNEFLLAVPEKLRLIQKYIDNKNADELKRTIHASKPMLVAVGINREEFFDEDICNNGYYEQYFKNAEELYAVTEQALKEIRTVYENEYAAQSI